MITLTNSLLQHRKLNLSKIDQLSAFSFIWAVTSIIHLASFRDWISTYEVFSWLTFFASLVVILQPYSVTAFLALLVFSIFKTIGWMPDQPNHILFELIVNISMLFTICWTITYNRRNRSFKDVTFREEIFHSFAPIARICLIILYAYAVVHKLNRDFLNADISCGSFLLAGIAERLPIIPMNEVSKTTAVWGTLIVESAIPLFLVFRSTRTAGILLGFALHAFFTLHPHGGLFSFSALMYALYFLFFPADFLQQLKQIVIQCTHSQWRKLPGNLKVLALLFPVYLLLVFLITYQLGYITKVSFIIWAVWAVVYVFVYLAVSTTRQEKEEPAGSVFTMAQPLFWIFPAMVIINGLSPYLGLKTQTSFSMFSNLRTEGTINNHLFMPKLQLLAWQDNLIDIVQSDATEFGRYVQQKQFITEFEFRRLAGKLSDSGKEFYVEFIYNGLPHRLEVKQGVSNLPAFTKQDNVFIRKMVRFRPIDKGPVCLCKH